MFVSITFGFLSQGTPEDLQLGHCFFSLGVRTWDTRDNLGREFLSFTDPKTWSQGFTTVLTLPWYYRGRYLDNFGAITKHLATFMFTVHVGYDRALKRCWLQIFDAICANEKKRSHCGNTISTVGTWFDNHRHEVVTTTGCRFAK